MIPLSRRWKNTRLYVLAMNLTARRGTVWFIEIGENTKRDKVKRSQAAKHLI